ncbi:MAG TPA: hypothetical protein VIR00_01445 [Micromonosporaceae bacterium]
MNPNQPQYPVPGNQPAPAGAGRGLSFALSDVIVGGAAFLFFIFSFTPFVSLGALHTDLWDFTSPLGWWAAVANVLLLATAVAALRWPRDKEYVGFRRSQVQVGLGLYVFLFVLGILFAEHSIFGWGGWLMLICSLVALTGAVLGHLNMLQEPVAIPTGRTSKPAGYQGQPAGGYAPPQDQAGYEPPATTNYTPGQAPAQPPHQDDTI